MRPEWEGYLSSLCKGDCLAVCELSRLRRNTGSLAELAEELKEHEVDLRIPNFGIDTPTPAGKLIFTIVAAVTGMTRELLLERTYSGLAAARTGQDRRPPARHH